VKKRDLEKRPKKEILKRDLEKRGVGDVWMTEFVSYESVLDLIFHETFVGADNYTPFQSLLSSRYPFVE